MRTISYKTTKKNAQIRLSVDGAVINIATGQADLKGRTIIKIEILPEQPGWKLLGQRDTIQIVKLKQQSKKRRST